MRRGPQKREIQMNKKWIAAGFAALAATTMWGGAEVKAAFDENLNAYTLDAVVVEADRTKNKFGDTITEQSYYRTGGDVKVITREEIEKRHYVDMTDAIKRIPGVTFSNPGYRGGQYGYQSYSNTMAINGDARVVVLIDGRRVDNSVSSYMGSSSTGSKTMVDLNELVNMEQVDKIEVIKGPGASAYGADATGGVINIITRKGTDEMQGTIDLSTGSWDRHVYNVSLSGAAGDDKSLKYFITASRQMSGDTKYHDGVTGKDYTYVGSGYKDDSVSFRVDKEFDNERNLTIWYNHQNGIDGYPLNARDMRYWNEADWNRIIKATNGKNGIFGDPGNPGYRNLFYLDAIAGSFNGYRKNDLDVTYTFNKDNGMDSFVRVYSQRHRYWGRDSYTAWTDDNGTPKDYSDDLYAPFPDSPEFKEWVKNHPVDMSLTGDYEEQNHGLQLQLAKRFGIHDVIASVSYDKSKFRQYRDYSETRQLYRERDSIQAYVQDKMHLSDKWDFTPALRFTHYGDAKGTYFTRVADPTPENPNKTKKIIKAYAGGTSSNTFTPAINTEYAFSDSFSAYAGWTRIYRPLHAGDYSTITPNGKALDDEKGNVWTFGVIKELSDRVTLTAHYDYTKMSNAVTSYSVMTKNDEGKYEPEERSVNAKETKKAFNVTLDSQLDDHWTLSLGYTKLDDKWEAKDGVTFDPDLTWDKSDNVNAMINSLRPTNHYTANLSYESGKWYTGLLVNWYTGNDTSAFSDRRFLVLDWNLNYEVNKDLTTYVSVTNLTNEGYENAYSPYNGIGATPQLGRAFMVGARYKF